MTTILHASAVTNVKQYPIAAAAKQGINEVIKSLQERDIIFRTHSAFNSPVWPAKKPDGSWRLTVDYWRLNTNTGPLTAAVPNIANLTVSLQASAHKWMAVLHIKDTLLWCQFRRKINPNLHSLGKEHNTHSTAYPRSITIHQLLLTMR